MKVFILTKPEIEQLINYREILDVVAQSFADYNSGEAIIPPVTNLEISEFDEVHIKPGHIKTHKNYCVKIASHFRDNPKRGLPPAYGMMILYDAETGVLSGLLFDEALLTHLRTGAAGAIAAQYLAKKDVTSVGVLGAGVQARMQMIFLAQVRKFQKLHVWNKFEEELEQYCKDMRQKLPDVEIITNNSPSEVAENAEILVTATPTRTPLISKSDLHPGLHITALGSDGPVKQEINTDAFTILDKVVVDNLNQCSHLGELHHALDDGTMTIEKVHAEIGDMILGNRSGRERDDEITLCDLTGVAVQDIAISNWALHKAKKNNLGKTIEF